MEALLSRIRDTIKLHHLLSPGEPVLLAVSGGPDSVFLAWAMKQLGFEAGMAHVNYGLRGAASEAEEALVRRLAGEWKMPLFVHHLDTRKELKTSSLSLQMLARQVRYRFFEEVMQANGYSRCATGHHAGDQAETILLSLVKDNDFEVLHSIPYQRGPFVRPLLDLGKGEILTALDQLGLEYGQDASNQQSTYARNRIRNEVLPQLARINPAIETQLLGRQAWYERQVSFLAHHFEQWYQRCVTFDPGQESYRLSWHDFEREYGRDFTDLLVVFVFRRWGMHGQALWEVLRLCESQPGRELVLQGRRITRLREGLGCKPLDAPEEVAVQEVAVERESLLGKCEVHIGGHTVHITLPWRAPVRLGRPDDFYFDSNKVLFPLRLRSWREGDRMVPFGMRRSKKLSDIFIDEKYSPEEKAQALVIEDAEKIIALSGFRIADTVKMDNKTREVMRIVIEGKVESRK